MEDAHILRLFGDIPSVFVIDPNIEKPSMYIQIDEYTEQVNKWLKTSLPPFMYETLISKLGIHVSAGDSMFHIGDKVEAHGKNPELLDSEWICHWRSRFPNYPGYIHDPNVRQVYDGMVYTVVGVGFYEVSEQIVYIIEKEGYIHLITKRNIRMST